jgi:DNA (cytosine-5)-methyltransferase 1
MKDTHVDTTITTLEFCAGYGGIGLGLKNIFGERLRCLAYCELEGFAQANLISKMEKGLLDVAPLWNDLKTFPYGKFHGLVDILIAGYPCQPFSAAGKRAGKDDPRHLWPWIADGIRVLRPRACFLENVEGHISLGLSTVVSDLEELGYKVSWGIFSASEVGAPHQRKRVFILGMADSADGRGEGLHDGDAEPANALPRCAWPSRPGEPQHGWEPPRVVVANSKRSRGEEPEHLDANLSPEPSGCDTESVGNASQREDHGREPRDLGGETGQGRCGDHAADRTGEVLGNAEGQRPATLRAEHEGLSGQLCAASAGDEAMGNSSRQRCEQNTPLRGEQQPSGSSEERGTGVAEAMGDTKKHDRGNESEWSPAFGLEQSSGGQTQPPLGGNIDGNPDRLDDAELFTTCDNRTDELRLLGNGVCPPTAERAFRVLTEELFQEK